MKVLAKAGVALLALVLAALPVVACTLPGAVMTSAERECCKRMADQCGRAGMAKSHGCCEIQTAPNDFHALKASSSQLDHSAIGLHAQPVAFQMIVGSQLIFSTDRTSPPHSPPGLLYSATTILRI